MRVLIKSYGNVAIFYCKMLGFKRYYVSWRMEHLKLIQVYGIMKNK